MRAASSRTFWLVILGSAGVLFAGQLLWATLATYSRATIAKPAIAPKSPNEEKGPTIGSRRRIYDAFPPIVQPGIAAGEVDDSPIADDEFVIGVEVGDESRAYPLNMLGHPGSEVVNDTLGGKPIAVTFCGLCETPLVFSRRVDNEILTFYVSGVVVESNMLIKDVETHSGWVQLLGKGVDGPLKGKELERLPSTWTDWKTWRAGHPSTSAIQLKRGTKRYSPGTADVAASRKQTLLDNLQWGLSVGGKARSWAFAGLATERVVNDAFDGRPLLIAFDPAMPAPAGYDRRLDGRVLSFTSRGDDLVDDQTGSTWDPSTGRATRGSLEGRRLEPVAGTIAASTIWRAFYPESEAWGSLEPAVAPASKGRE